MRYILLPLFLIGCFVNILASNEYNLKNTTSMININVDTVDINKLLIQSDEKMQNYDFAKLKLDINSVNKHKKRISKIQDNLKKLSNLKIELESNYVDIQHLEQNIKKAKEKYDRIINQIYNKNKQIDRYSYLVVISKNGTSTTKDIENYVIDKFAIKKYDQSTTLNKSLASTKMQSIIKTQKDFGQKSVDTIYDHIVRSNNLTINVIKVTQNPFIKSNNITSNKSIVTLNNTFNESKVNIYDLRENTYSDIADVLEDDYKISEDNIKQFMQNIKPKIDILEYKKDFLISTNKMTQVLLELEKKHIEQSSKIAQLKSDYDMKKIINKDMEPHINKLLATTQKLLKPYNISLTKESIGKVSIVTPKVYSEIVQYKEEREYIHRKVNSFVSNITITDLQQSDTLIDFSNLTSTTKNQHKTIEFRTVSLLPFLDKSNKIGILIFTSIEVKDKLTDDDLIDFKFKYDDVKFIPVQQGYKTIFASTKEVTLGLVKEFLETNSYKRYFDQYCIDNSFLPEEAKDYKNISEEFYNYPAVCFKVDKVNKFINWASNKIKRKLIIPDASTWAYVATNGGTTDYCWGNATPEELLEEDKLPENIYIDGAAEDTTIQKVSSFTKSKLGLYDMCGNVFELVKQDDDFGYKGNSFSSYIELSNGEAESYEDDVNSALGLRLFYIKDLTNE